jgi:hypothetical protein
MSMMDAVIEDARFGHRWSRSEDHRLEYLITTYGEHDQWERIALEHDPITFSRTATMCLNRWRYVLKPGIAKGSWTAEEDEIVIRCMNEVNTLV